MNWNLEAEQVTVGACLLSPAVIPEIMSVVHGGDFFRPAHEIIFDVVVRQHMAGLPSDAVAVAAVLSASGDISRTGGPVYLHTLISSVPVAANGPWYARIVADLSLRRRVAAAGARIAQRAEEPDADIAEVLQAAETDLAHATARWQPQGADVMDIASFVLADLPHTDPVIPGLLHQQDRAVVVAPEGSGKSELAIQAAVMTAAGLHVFTAQHIEPARSLIIDLENPSANVQGRARRFLRLAESSPGWDPRRCHIWSKPGGLDLRDASDARLLMTVISKADPKLIVAGPVKKMSVSRGETGDVLATGVTAFWDRVREKLGPALWLEHHAPLRQGFGEREMRPINAALWTSWPEFGLSLYPSDDGLDAPGTMRLGSFRGHRESDRLWPVKLRRSRPWSWEGVYPEGTFTDLR